MLKQSRRAAIPEDEGGVPANANLELLLKRYQHAQAKHAAALRKLRLASTVEKRWRAKVRYYTERATLLGVKP